MSIDAYDAEVRLVYGLAKDQTVQEDLMRAFGDVVLNLLVAAVTWKVGSEGHQMPLRFRCSVNEVDDAIVVLLKAADAVDPERVVEFETKMTELVKASVPFFIWKISHVRAEVALNDHVIYSSGASAPK